MASQLLTGFFIIVDGFFIGQSIGDVGLASINILWPIAAVILATGLGIGSGGSVVMTHARGAGDTEKALAARGNTLLCLGYGFCNHFGFYLCITHGFKQLLKFIAAESNHQLIL